MKMLSGKNWVLVGFGPRLSKDNLLKVCILKPLLSPVNVKISSQLCFAAFNSLSLCKIFCVNMKNESTWTLKCSMELVEVKFYCGLSVLKEVSKLAMKFDCSMKVRGSSLSVVHNCF